MRTINGSNRYTKEFLLSKLTDYKNEYGKPPSGPDIDKNPNYPNSTTYCRNFGSLSNALKLVGLDFDSMLEKGEAKLDCTFHVGRLGEI